MEKLIILGSGAAGWTAAIYAARADLFPVVITGNDPGGQLTITNDVENYPGFAEAITGPELMQRMQAQAERFGAKTVYDNIKKFALDSKNFKLTGSLGEYRAQCVIVATGASAKWLGLTSEKLYMGKGVSGCATCDGFFFKGKTVCVIGGGNTAAEEALYLTHHAKKIYLIHRREQMRAEKILQSRIIREIESGKIEPIWNAQIEEILGDGERVNGVKLKFNNGDIKEQQLDGVFVAIGHKPNSEIFTGLLDIDPHGYIITAPKSTHTNISGIFAAGDVQDAVYRQAVTAAGSGCMAALDAERYLNT